MASRHSACSGWMLNTLAAQLVIQYGGLCCPLPARAYFGDDRTRILGTRVTMIPARGLCRVGLAHYLGLEKNSPLRTGPLKGKNPGIGMLGLSPFILMRPVQVNSATR